jgi:hypothetical protein
VVVASHEQSAGLDAALDAGDLRLRAELAVRRLVYEDGKREEYYTPGVFWGDRVELDGYVLAAYRVGRFEPYAYFEVYRWPTAAREGFVIPSVGLNYHFTPSTQLKLQYLDTLSVDFSDPQVKSTNRVQILSSRLVMAL